MLTQTIKTTLTQKKLSDIIFRAEEEGREIQFEIYEEDGTTLVDLTGITLKFIMLKPDGNVVYKTCNNGTLTQTAQMTTAKGTGFYCIRLSADDVLIYSAGGRVLIDDHVVEDENLESISEVDGLVFPDDFLTTESGVAVIDDTHQNYTETWSSEKIAQEAAGIAGGLIADNQIALDHTWSSEKINTELNAKVEIDDETIMSTDTWSSAKIADELAEKAEIDDTDESVTTTWSSDKIAQEIASASPTVSDDYTLTEQQIGTWLGTTMYRRVVEVSGVKQPGSYYTLFSDNTINLIKYEGIVQNGYWTGAGCMLNSYYNASNYCGCSYYSNDGARIDWYNNLGTAVSKIYLIIYYTKK